MHISSVNQLGELEPASELLRKLNENLVELDCFTNGALIPECLISFLAEKGYEPAEHADMALLFASHTGVTMHSDECESVIWVLEAPTQAVELISGHTVTTLEPGMVLWCDTTQNHGVIFSDPKHRRWSVFSLYVKKI